MEKVYFRVHDRLIRATCKLLPPVMRRFNEWSLLLLALCSLWTLGWLHSSYITLDRSANNCLKSLILNKARTEQMDYREYDLIKFTIVPISASSSPSPSSSSSSSPSFSSSLQDNSPLLPENHYNYNFYCHNPLWTELYILDDYYMRKSDIFQRFFVTNSIFEKSTSYYYAKDKAIFNYIDETTSSPHPDGKALKVLEVSLSRDSSCFGPFSLTILLRSFVTYDATVINWMGSLVGAHGFLLNGKSREEFDLSFLSQFIDQSESTETEISPPCDANRSIISLFSKANVEYIMAKAASKLIWKATILASSLFIFFASSTVVSFTLRETQMRMLRFSHLLERHVSQNIPINSIVFTHIVETLVFVPIMGGFMFFHFQFFYDKLLAFMLLSLVWIVEVYGAICVRSKLSIMYFPRFTICYFTICHLYVIAYPYGHTYFAVFVLMLFLFHAMMYFYNNAEIPSFWDGTICEQNPRESVVDPALIDNGSSSSSIINNRNRNNSDSLNSENSDTSIASRASNVSRTSSSASISINNSNNINYSNNISNNNNQSRPISAPSDNSTIREQSNASSMDGNAEIYRQRSSSDTNKTKPKPHPKLKAERRHSDTSSSDLSGDFILGMARNDSQQLNMEGAFFTRDQLESPPMAKGGHKSPLKYSSGLYNLYPQQKNQSVNATFNINTPAVTPAKHFTEGARQGFEALLQRPDIVGNAGILDTSDGLQRLIEMQMSENKKKKAANANNANSSVKQYRSSSGSSSSNSSTNKNNKGSDTNSISHYDNIINSSSQRSQSGEFSSTTTAPLAVPINIDNNTFTNKNNEKMNNVSSNRVNYINSAPVGFVEGSNSVLVTDNKARGYSVHDEDCESGGDDNDALEF